jgi:hypothetical protein
MGSTVMKRAFQLGRQKFTDVGEKLCFASAEPVQNTTISSLYIADAYFADFCEIHPS